MTKIAEAFALLVLLTLMAACAGQEQDPSLIGPTPSSGEIQAVDQALRDFFRDIDNPQRN